jgi:hypothetical protein
MRLRHSKILKLLAIILFSFELLMPSIFASTLDKDYIIEPHGKNILSPIHGTGLSTFLIFEERSEEEREGKDDVAYTLVDFYSDFFCNAPAQSIGSELSLVHTRRLFNTHPPLFKLHQVFLI